jgi:hypothetical protein
MAKKRKAAIKSQQDIGTANGTSTAAVKLRFESFPLHLLPDRSNRKNGTTPSLKLQELHPGRVWVIPSFFSDQECQAWVDFCESSGGLEYTAHPADKYIAHRECYRMQQVDAVELATRIFQRLRDKSGGCLKCIQQECGDLYPSQRVPIGCNPNLRVYKYTKGHSFGKHVDGSNMIGKEGGYMQGCSTEMTMLIYLSECTGGATRFHTGRPKGKSNKASASSFVFQPQVGALLLHVHGDHCLEHEADPVIDGNKYVLRTDLVFS